MARINLGNVPIPIGDLLRSYEFTTDVTRDGVAHGELYNLVLTNVEYRVASIQGNLVRDDFVPARHYGSTTKRPDPPKILPTVVSLELGEQDFLRKAKDVIAFGVRPKANQEKLRYDVVHFQMEPNTLLMPHPERTQFAERIGMELFAGGYGGWAWARKQATRFGAPSIRNVAVEIDHDAAMQHAINHAEHVFPPQAKTPRNLLQHLEGDCLFVQAVEDWHWKISMGTVRHECWTVSASCQSWSNAGRERGLDDSRGMTLFHALATARIFRPKALLIEQVKGFRSHRDFSHFLSMLHWAGYYCWNEEVNELSDLCPIRRPRFLAIYLRDSVQWDTLPKYQHWGQFETMYPHQFGSWLKSTPQEMQALIPEDPVKDMYMHPDLFPYRVQGELSTHKIFQTRVPGVMRIQPVAMAMYGQQHLLSLQLLLDKGLQGFFCQEGGQYRWYKPLELILMHLQLDPIICLKPLSKAWRHIGNMIAMPHALLQLLNAWRALGEIPDNLSMPKVFAHVRQNRLQANQIQCVEDPEAWFMAKPENLQHMIDRKAQFLSLFGQTTVRDCEMQPDFFVHQHVGRTSISSFVAQAQQTRTALDHRQEPPETPLSFEVVADEMEANEGNQVKNDSLKRPLQQDDAPQASQWTAVIPFLLPGEYGQVWVHSSVPLQHVMTNWFHEVVLAKADHSSQILSQTDLAGKVIAYPVTAMPRYCHEVDNRTPWGEPHHTVVFRRHEEIQLLAGPVESRIVQLPGMFHEDAQVWYDEFGEVPENAKLRMHQVLTHEFVADSTLTEVHSLIESFAKASVQTYVPNETDILVVVIKATPWEVREILDVWALACPPAWQTQHGRKLHVQISEDQGRILFVPWCGKNATPVTMLQGIVQVRLARMLLRAFHVSHGILVVFKLPPDQPMEQIYEALRHAFVITEQGYNISLVAYGKRVGGSVTPHELQAMRGKPQVVVQIRHSLWGGGPSPGTKREHHHMLHTEMAAIFHEQGFSVQQRPELIERILREFGTSKVHHVLFKAPNKQEAFQQLCDDLGIVPPPLKTKNSTTRMKFQRLAKVEGMEIHVQDYALQAGFFQYENGESADILSALSAWTRGILLMDLQQAKPWLQQNAAQSPDELALFIPTPAIIRAERPVSYLQAPAKDKDGRQVLLGGSLLQLGEKQIQVKKGDGEAATCPTMVCSVTMWKEEYHPDQWRILIQSPVKYANQTLGSELSAAILNPWGRSFKNGKISVTPPEAISVQFHCEVHRSQLPDVLRISGYNKLHMIPKTAEGKASPDYSVIWLDGTMQELQAKASMLPGHAGFVKSKKRHGARFESTAFET